MSGSLWRPRRWDFLPPETSVWFLHQAQSYKSAHKSDKSAHSMDWTSYHGLEDIYDWLDVFLIFPHFWSAFCSRFDYLDRTFEFCEKEVIGQTHEGQDMIVMKVHDVFIFKIFLVHIANNIANIGIVQHTNQVPMQVCKGGCGNKPAMWIDRCWRRTRIIQSKMFQFKFVTRIQKQHVSIQICNKNNPEARCFNLKLVQWDSRSRVDQPCNRHLDAQRAGRERCKPPGTHRSSRLVTTLVDAMKWVDSCGGYLKITEDPKKVLPSITQPRRIPKVEGGRPNVEKDDNEVWKRHLSGNWR